MIDKTSAAKMWFILLTIVTLSACMFVSKSAGIDVGTNGRVGASADLDFDFFTPDERWSLNTVFRVRAGSPFFDAGIGAGGCGHIEPISLGICGRIFLLEAGSYQKQFTLGSGSPQLYLIRSIRLNIDPETGFHRHLLVARLGAGYDVRPLNEWYGSTPYVNANFGYFF